MTESTLLWLALAGLAGWNLRMQWWIVGHSERLARVESEVAGAKVESRRIADNLHSLRGELSPLLLRITAALERGQGIR